MTSYPWYLLAVGIFIVIIGALLAAVVKPAGRPGIDPKMRDKEIIRNLQRGERISLPKLVVFVGLLCILVSVVWRIVLIVVWAVHST